MLVLRPAENGEPPLDWQRDTFGSIADMHFRVSLPCRTLDGDFESAGWSAWQFVEGVHEEGRWREIIAVGERFHDALADVPEPAFVAERGDPWAIGDRVAWGDLPADEFMAANHLPELAAARRTLDAKCQLVHGDLTGNVLFAPNLPPAIIDFSPYWRPPAYASAVVVADALVWEGADESLLSAVAHIPRFAQFLIRALIMRVVVDWLFRVHEPMQTNRDDPFSTAAALACRLAASDS
jgi:uncharacterized protein (TIGR02569 family)